MNFEISIPRSSEFRRQKFDLFTPALADITLSITAKMPGLGTTRWRLLLDDELKATLS